MTTPTASDNPATRAERKPVRRPSIRGRTDPGQRHDIARRRSTIGLRVGLLVLSAFALVLLATVIERVVYAGQVLPGIDIDGVDAEGRSETDVRADVDRLADRLESEPLQARAGATDLEVDPTTVALRIDREATVRAARAAGRSRNPLAAVGSVVTRRFRHEEIDLATSYDTNAVEGVIDGWQAQVNDGVREGDLRFDGARVIVVEPRPGSGIERPAARARLVALIESPRRSRITLPVGRVEPAVSSTDVEALAARARRILSAGYVITTDPGTTITGPTTTGPTDTTSPAAIPESVTVTIEPEQVGRSLDARVRGSEIELIVRTDDLATEMGDDYTLLTTPARDADFEVRPDNTVRVVPSTAGLQPDLRAIGRSILAERRRIESPLKVLVPEHDTEWAESLGITEFVSSFTTHHPCCAPRVTNIHNAADYIDGTVLEPGEVFSLNDVVGARTEARGFVAAPVFYDGDFTEDFGGGVSQIATTTFNAAWWGGFEIVTHKPHTIYFDRYPMAREATVNYPRLDLKWKNDSDHGVLVKAIYNDTDITIAIYGDTEGKVVKEENGQPGCSVGPLFDTRDDPRCINILTTIEVETEEIPCEEATSIDDPDGECATLAPGQRREVADGHRGYAVEYWRVITRPGSEPVREKFFWQYAMFPDKILVGIPEDPPPTTTTAGPTATTSPTATTAPPRTTTVPTTTAP